MRSLFLTTHLLQNEGIRAEAEMVQGHVLVSIEDPRPNGKICTAIFPDRQMDEAADWLVTRVKDLYPRSVLARIWQLVSKASDAQAEGRDL
jgi:hypothetical protein